MGCVFILMTIMREPMKRFESHLKYFEVPKDEVVEFSRGYGSNYMLRYLIYGECNYESEPYRCTGHDIPAATENDIEFGIDILNQFDLIGTVKDFQVFKEQFSELTGLRVSNLKKIRSSKQIDIGLTPFQQTVIQEYGIEVSLHFHATQNAPNSP